MFFCTSSTLWCDNLSAAHLARNPVFHSRAKHIELDLHFIRDKVLHNELIVSYIPSTEQVADILTKNLSSSQFCNLRTKLLVVPYPVSLRGDVNQTHPNQDPVSYNKSNGLTNPTTCSTSYLNPSMYSVWEKNNNESSVHFSIITLIRDFYKRV